MCARASERANVASLAGHITQQCAGVRRVFALVRRLAAQVFVGAHVLPGAFQGCRAYATSHSARDTRAKDAASRNLLLRKRDVSGGIIGRRTALAISSTSSSSKRRARAINLGASCCPTFWTNSPAYASGSIASDFSPSRAYATSGSATEQASIVSGRGGGLRGRVQSPARLKIKLSHHGGLLPRGRPLTSSSSSSSSPSSLAVAAPASL